MIAIKKFVARQNAQLLTGMADLDLKLSRIGGLGERVMLDWKMTRALIQQVVSFDPDDRSKGWQDKMRAVATSRTRILAALGDWASFADDPIHVKAPTVAALASA